MTGITEHLNHLRVRIALAAQGCGRGPADVTLVAVSKGHPSATVQAARAAGLRHFGESYLQEALPKIGASDRDLAWHFIGRLQSNKTRAIARDFTWVQTVTEPRVAERLSGQRPPYGGDLQVLIQIRPAGIAGRSGCPAGEVARLATAVAGLPRLKFRGIMIIPQAGLDAAALRQEYARTRAVFDELQQNGHDIDTLSMGMSDDFELAIAGGSTMVRIGTALFGPRPSG